MSSTANLVTRFAFIYEGSSAHGQQKSGESLGLGIAVAHFRHKVIDRTGLIVILKEDGEPAAGIIRCFKVVCKEGLKYRKSSAVLSSETGTMYPKAGIRKDDKEI